MRYALILTLTLGLLSLGCGGESPSEPSKELLVDTLRNLHSALEAGALDDALVFLRMPEGISPEDAKKGVGTFIEKREISAAGIDKLEAEGRYGTLEEVFAERGTAWAKRAGVDIGTCYALSLGDAEVAALWDGTRFKIIRLDDVGKL